MAIAVAAVGDNKLDYYGATPAAMFDVTLDNSYPAGGYAVTNLTFGLSRPIAGIAFIASNTAAVVSQFQYNNQTGKIMVLASAAGVAGTAPFQDATAAANFSTYVLRVIVLGRR